MLRNIVVRAAEGHTSARCPCTGLTEAERRQQTIQWAWRVIALMEQTGCSARIALKAIEAVDSEVA